MPEIAERIDLPNGCTVWYIEEHPTDPKQNHSYWRHNPKTGKKGKRLTGVTTAVKTLDHDPKNLLRWAARTQCIGVSLLYGRYPDYLDWLDSPEAMWRELEDHGLTYENVRDQAATEGTNVHRDAFERLALGQPTPDFEKLSDRERGLTQGVIGFWLDHDPKAEQVEQVVYSERLGVAGRLDFRGALGSRCDNPLCACRQAKGPGVIDLKTGGFISAAAHAQVGGGYPLLAMESGFGESGWAAILQVREDGTYDFFGAAADSVAFEAAVKTYRAAGRINGVARKAREARETQRSADKQIAEAVHS